MKSISLKLPDELHAKLEHVSKQRGAAKSDIIREALEAYFAGQKNGASCLDLARDLAGSIDGRADLATNPKYMRAYGR
jgi:predicted transcriptional regulator